MKYDNKLRRGLEQVIFTINDDWKKQHVWLDLGLLDVLDIVETEMTLQGRDDHEETAFCICRVMWNNPGSFRPIEQYEIENIENHMMDAAKAVGDLYLAAYHLDDDIHTKTEGRRSALSDVDKERLKMVAIKIIRTPDDFSKGVFEGPGEKLFSFISARDEFCQLSVDPGCDIARKRSLLWAMRLFVEVEKEENPLSNRYWGEYGDMEKFVDDSDREVSERVRELLGILIAVTAAGLRLKPLEKGVTGKYYPQEKHTVVPNDGKEPFEVDVGIRTDVDEDGNLIDWPRTEPGLYEVVEDDDDDDDVSFEGLGSLFG